jgi:hypothetical protein
MTTTITSAVLVSLATAYRMWTTCGPGWPHTTGAEDSQTRALRAHSITGRILVEGEETGDMWRLVATGTDVRKEIAVFHWPDGTTEPTRQ